MSISTAEIAYPKVLMELLHSPRKTASAIGADFRVIVAQIANPKYYLALYGKVF